MVTKKYFPQYAKKKNAKKFSTIFALSRETSAISSITIFKENSYSKRLQTENQKITDQETLQK